MREKLHGFKALYPKLRSRTGASITFALLIFLVCAVLSSIIIAAATTAAGRMSRIAETDQRYYAVTSAAELLQETLEDESKVESIVKVGEVWLVNGQAADINTVGGDGESKAEWKLIDSAKAIQEEAARRAYYFLESGENDREWNLTSDAKEEYSISNDPLKVTITAHFESVGAGDLRMKLTVKSDGDNPYQLVMSFLSNRPSETKQLSDPTSIPSTSTEATIITLEWKLAEVTTG